jgi:hypothetical protein
VREIRTLRVMCGELETERRQSPRATAPVPDPTNGAATKSCPVPSACCPYPASTRAGKKKNGDPLEVLRASSKGRRCKVW